MSTIQTFFVQLWLVCLEAAPWLLIGIIISGLIKVWLPAGLLQRWLGGRGVWPVLKASLIGTPLPLCSCSVIPAAVTVGEAEVRLLNDESLFLQMLEMFHEQTPELIETMNAHYEQQDFELLRRDAHKLKGSASAIGANGVLVCAKELEAAAQSADEQQCQSVMQVLNDKIDQMLVAISDYKLAKTSQTG